MSKIIIIGSSDVGSVTAINAIHELKQKGNEVIIVKNEKDMNINQIPMLSAISMFEKLGRNDYDNRTGLSHQEQEIYAYGKIALIKEFNLIKEKKSKLSSNKRNIVINRIKYELNNNNFSDYEMTFFKEQYDCSQRE